MRFDSIAIVAFLLLFSTTNWAVASADGSMPEVVKASPSELANFKDDPQSLLKTYPIGGIQLTSIVKSLLLADPSLLSRVLAIAKSSNATGQQVVALGSGVGFVVKSLRESASEDDRKLAALITAEVGQSGSNEFLAGFDSGSKGLRTFAIGPSTGRVVGGAIGGPVNTANFVPTTRNAQTPGSETTPNSTESFTFPGAVYNCQTSVSPARTC